MRALGGSAWQRPSAGFVAEGGGIAVASRAELRNYPAWTGAFVGHRKDHRYFELVEDTLPQGFDYRYFVLTDGAGCIRGVQPFFLLDQDLFAGASPSVQAVISRIRKMWPRFLSMRTLMIGCTAGEGHVDGDDELSRRTAAQVLAPAVAEHARALQASMIVFKEFHGQYRETLGALRDSEFTRVPSLPMTRLGIDYVNFEDYMRRGLSRMARKNLRRKFKAAARAAPIGMEVMTDITPLIDEAYPLYLAVYNRSKLHFEKLTQEYLCELGRRMPDKVRFFVWRQNGRMVAFSLCMVHGDTIYDEYLGLDYSVALDLHLYHYTFRDVVSWAMREGYRSYVSSSLNYDPKLHLRCRLEPLDLYIRHTSPVLNAILKVVLPLIAPTRRDKTLKRFPNYGELWGTA